MAPCCGCGQTCRWGPNERWGDTLHTRAHNWDNSFFPTTMAQLLRLGVLSSRYRGRVIIPERRHRIYVDVISGESGWSESENYRRKHSVRDKAGVGQTTKHDKEGDNCGQIKTASRQNDRTLKSQYFRLQKRVKRACGKMTDERCVSPRAP